MLGLVIGVIGLVLIVAGVLAAIVYGDRPIGTAESVDEDEHARWRDSRG